MVTGSVNHPEGSALLPVDGLTHFSNLSLLISLGKVSHQ